MKFPNSKALLAGITTFILTLSVSFSTGMLNGLFKDNEQVVAPYAYLLDQQKELSKITKHVVLKPVAEIKTIDVTDWRNFPEPGEDGTFESYLELFTAVSHTTGVPVMTLAKMAAVESGFRSDAVAKCPKGVKCNAKGLFQFIDGTWEMTVAKHGARFNLPKKADPMNGVQNTLMAAMHIRDNIELLKTVITDRPINVTDLYMMHFLGRSGAIRFFSADANKKAAFSHKLAATSNYNIFYNNKRQARTFNEVYAFLDNRLETRVSEFMTN